MAKSDEDHSLILLHLDEVRQVQREIRVDQSEIRKDVNELVFTTIKQQAILDDHVRRTELAEEHIAAISSKGDKQVEEIHEELEPLKRQYNMWNGVGKAILILASLASIAGVLVKILTE